jgi:PilZ domain
MSLPPEKRKDRRVEFSRDVDFHMVAIDGTWRRACLMVDVSAGGAKLIATEPLEGLKIEEFLLVLPGTNVAFRRCKLAWVNGDQLGVHFLDIRDGQTPPSKTN